MQHLTLQRPPAMDCVATVLSSIQLTPTIKSIRLRLDRSNFRFLPGQSVWPFFERDGRQFKKIYSIASSPTQCPEIELCVSRVGWSSAYLQDLEVGQTIAARGPYGLMTLEQLPDRPRIYIAEGSGIAPLKSQIEWLKDCNFSCPIWLIQSNPETPDQLPYWDYWRSLSQSWAQFTYVEAIEHPPETVLSQRSLNLQEFDIDICGVTSRPVHIQNAVLALGAKPVRVRFESFFAF